MKIKDYLKELKWRFIKLIAGKEPVIVNCVFNCDALKDGWSVWDSSNIDKSFISARYK